MRIFLISFTAVLFFAVRAAMAQSCPSGDDPALVQKITDKHQLVLCGYEDHEFPEEKGQRAFSDFKLLSFVGDKSTTVYTSDEGETFLIGLHPKGMTLIEVWEVGDKSLPAVSHDVVCENDSCKITSSKCILKAPRNPYPTALKDLEGKMKKGKLKSDAEDLVDNVFAQAAGGDAAATQFLTRAQLPKGFEGANAEAWTEAHKRIQLLQKLKCP
jgi:hypothetical protein